MELLIKNETDLSQILPQNSSVDFQFVKPFLQDAQDEFLSKVVGETQLETLQASIDAAEIDDALMVELAAKCKPPVAYLGLIKALPHMNVNMHQGGFTVNTDDNTQPASQWRVNELRDQLGRAAQLKLDELIVFLDKNADTFIDYRDSGIPQKRFANFINTSEQWNKSVQHNLGPWMIDAIRPTMESIEEMVIRPILCSDFFDELKALIKSRSDVAAFQTAIDIIQRIVACRTLAELTVLGSIDITPSQGVFMVWREENARNSSKPATQNDREQVAKRLEATASKWQTRLKEELNANPDTYTTFAASDCANSTNVKQPAAPTSGGGIFPGIGIGK